MVRTIVLTVRLDLPKSCSIAFRYPSSMSKVHGHSRSVLMGVCKVTAVDIPELSRYRDVIVVPNDGECSLPSMLAGGGMMSLFLRPS